MDYELAKKIKDAGFPQHEEGGDGYWYTPKTQIKRLGEKIVSEYAYAPTLSELIEACGDKFGTLDKNISGGWGCFSIDGNDTWGKTPEEAVAKLWLELNKK